MVEPTRPAGAAVPLEHPLPLDVALLRPFARARLEHPADEPLVDVLRGVNGLRRGLRALADEVERLAMVLPDGDELRGEVLVDVEVSRRLIERQVSGNLAVACEVTYRLAEMVLDMTDSFQRLRAAGE